MAGLLDLQSIGMNFGAVKALKGVDLTVHEGDVLGVCGDNGAGKSTMIKIISGAIRPTTGSQFLSGERVLYRSPGDALQKGVATIYQDLAVASRLSIHQNIFMGSELTKRTFIPGFRVLDKKRMRSLSRSYLDQLKITIPKMDSPVGDLSGGQRQAVAIARAIRWKARIVIMDEPTASLGVKETGRVLQLIRNLNDAGVTVILISHNMEDVVSVTNRVVVLKNGKKIAERNTRDLTAKTLAQLVMTGQEQHPVPSRLAANNAL